MTDDKIKLLIELDRNIYDTIMSLTDENEADSLIDIGIAFSEWVDAVQKGEACYLDDRK